MNSEAGMQSIISTVSVITLKFRGVSTFDDCRGLALRMPSSEARLIPGMKATLLTIAGILLLGSAPVWALGLTDLSANIVTPNGDGFNDQIRFVLDNPTSADVQGHLYDVSGHEVASLGLISSGTSTTLTWDGRNSSGSVVESGVYLYQISGDSSRIAGMVAVAR